MDELLAIIAAFVAVACFLFLSWTLLLVFIAVAGVLGLILLPGIVMGLLGK